MIYGTKPNPDMWERMNLAALNGAESVNAAELLSTLVGACSSILMSSGVVVNDGAARAHLAAMLLSPDTGPVGALLPLLHVELARLGAEQFIRGQS